MPTALEFDADYYRSTNPDLGGADEDLRQHFYTHGVREGRAGSRFCIREEFLKLASRGVPALEIGPFDGPLVAGPGVEYLDVLSADALRERARRLNRNPSGVPAEIQHVVEPGTFPDLRQRFESLVSAHLLEHQPCLVRHLSWAGKCLSPGGRYFLVLPDKRYCFDHYLASSTIADVLLAEMENRRLHTLASVIEHRALRTHNDSTRHWRGDHGTTVLQEKGLDALASAIQEFQAAQGTYLDVHAWKFHPECFADIIEALRGMNKIELTLERLFNTPHGRLEFCAVLRRVDDSSEP